MEWFLAVMLLCRDGSCAFTSDQFLRTSMEECRASLTSAESAFSAQGYATFGQCVSAKVEEKHTS